LREQSVENITNKAEVLKIAVFEKVEKLFPVFTEMGNPFEEESADLLALDKKLRTLPIQLIQDFLLLTIAEAKISSNPSLKD